MSGLGFKSNGGGSLDLVPIIKYDARAGRVSRIDRVQGASGWEAKSEDITANFRAVFDLENIEIGWMSFMGGAPDFAMFPMGEDHGEAPSDKHKEGFRIMLKLGKDCGGDVRELCSTANVVKGALGRLYDAYEAEKNRARRYGGYPDGDKPGKLPVVVLKSTRPIKSGSGTQTSTNYEPVFEIVEWVSRPADLVFKPKAKSGSAQGAAAPATGSTVDWPGFDPTAQIQGGGDFG